MSYPCTVNVSCVEPSIDPLSFGWTVLAILVLCLIAVVLEQYARHKG